MNDEAHAIREFLAQVFADEDAGGRRRLDEYLGEFAGHEQAIERAWKRLGPVATGTREGGEESTQRSKLGPFEFVRELGRGGQGVVYLARDVRLDREVAVKTLSGGWTETMRERFLREARLASQLDHPQLAGVLEVGVDEGVPWIAMPYVSGESLQQILARDGTLDPGESLRIVRHIADGLAAAHRQGVIHRDVKPGNILCSRGESERVVLTDFGIARELDATTPTLTSPGELIGTLPYLAPEVLDGQRADARSDVWSLGIVLHECLTGKVPYDAPTEGALIRAILRDPIPPLERRLGRDLGTVLQTALAKQPRDRYRSAVEFAADLHAVAEHRPIDARRSTAFGRALRWARREPLLAGLTAGLLIALSAGLAVSTRALADARAERDAKQSALGRAQTERDAKQQALDELEQLADQTRLARLRQKIDTFEPPWPERRDAMRAWLEDADRLLESLPTHRAQLAELASQGRPPTEAELQVTLLTSRIAMARQQLARNLEFLTALREREGPEAEGTEQIETVRKRIAELDIDLAEAAGMRFDDASVRWRHRLVSTLVDELETFASDDAHERTRARVTALLETAERLATADDDDHRAAWQSARAEIARAAPYGGFELGTQVGLRPLGADPTSGLHEFACLLSGTPPTRDGATGQLHYTEQSSIVYVLLPGGTARVGAGKDPAGPNFDPGSRDYEGPVATVELAPFFLAKHEMTQAQWLHVTGTNPSEMPPDRRFRDHPLLTLRNPVESVSWHDSMHITRKLGATLPTSAQWEYAARAGCALAFPTGKTPNSLIGYANLADLALSKVTGRPVTAELRELQDDGWGSHAPVGSFLPNAFGLFDCCGNVQEWCLDPFYDNRSAPRPGDGSRLVGELSQRILRGGSYLLQWPYARAAAIHTLRPTSNQYDHGLRPARAVQR